MTPIDPGLDSCGFVLQEGATDDKLSTNKLKKQTLYAQVELKPAWMGRLPSLKLFKRSKTVPVENGLDCRI